MSIVTSIAKNTPDLSVRGWIALKRTVMGQGSPLPNEDQFFADIENLPSTYQVTGGEENSVSEFERSPSSQYGGREVVTGLESAWEIITTLKGTITYPFVEEDASVKILNTLNEFPELVSAQLDAGVDEATVQFDDYDQTDPVFEMRNITPSGQGTVEVEIVAYQKIKATKRPGEAQQEARDTRADFERDR